ncbi:MAG: hypothetical protein ACLQVM_19055, partial [Terriglobia bacterium]
KTEGLVKRKIRMRICLGTTRVRESELQKEVAQFKSWGCGIAVFVGREEKINRGGHRDQGGRYFGFYL